MKRSLRRPPIIIPPPIPSPTAPASLIFLHGYNFDAVQFNKSPPNGLSVAHHIHKSPLLQHLKIIIPEGLPCRHPSIRKNVWYNIPTPIPPAGSMSERSDPDKYVEFGRPGYNYDDMKVTLDYLQSLIASEVENGTPANRIVVMGDSQGAGMAVLLGLTGRLTCGVVISHAGFPATSFVALQRMQEEYGLSGNWGRDVSLFMLHGKQDDFVPLEISRSWLNSLKRLKDRGQGFGKIEWKAIDGGQHSLEANSWVHVKEILEKAVPKNGFIPSLKL